MRGSDRSFSRLPVARALLAGAAILASMTASKAFSQVPAGLDDTAMALPRVSPHSGGGVALPEPLPPSEAARIRRIFALQAKGDIPAAVRETAALDPAAPLAGAMQGHILADRYLGRFTRSSAEDLRAWLDRWSDLPDAPAIHALLRVRLPRGATPPPAPQAASLASTQPEYGRPIPVPEESGPADLNLPRNPALDRAVHLAAHTGADAVRRLLDRTRGLAPAYAAQLRGEAAQILFTLNRDDEAYALAAQGAGEGAAALAGLSGGLAAWRLDRPDRARAMFESAWHAETTTPALRAAAAFWAARSQRRTGNASGYLLWMKRAAAERTTFYGILARRIVGSAHGDGGGGGGSDGREVLAEADIEAVASWPAGMRAFALLQAGQPGRAEAELRRLWPAIQDTPGLGRAVMLVAARANLTDLAAQLADLVQAADGRPREATRFPIPHLRPRNGFIVDPALVYAVARTESNFDAGLVSPSGASGLMQIMPETASFIVRTAFGGNAPTALHDPAVNLDLGQRYLAWLAGQDVVDGDLLRLLASYNAGPGGLTRLMSSIRHNGDPLLFMEAIPVDETREYLPRVLAYTWIYASRLHLPAPSLNELAAGEWPRYHPLTTSKDVARLN
jgi:soluble lytic murein transglycosylase